MCPFSAKWREAWKEPLIITEFQLKKLTAYTLQKMLKAMRMALYHTVQNLYRNFLKKIECIGRLLVGTNRMSVSNCIRNLVIIGIQTPAAGVM